MNRFCKKKWNIANKRLQIWCELINIVCKLIYFAGFALVNSCFKFNESLWINYGYNGTITTIWCENKCKDAVDKFLYYGTYVSSFFY